MRLFVFLLVSTLAFAAQYPHVFSSAGDEIYENMAQYEQIKDLDIYQDRPELLDAFCEDANRSMKAGFALDKVENDPELVLDKQALKEYAKTLRNLSNQNANIQAQIHRDMQALLEAKDTQHLKVFQKAGFLMSEEMLQLFIDEENEEKSKAEKKKLNSEIARLNEKNKKIELQSEKLAASTVIEEVSLQSAEVSVQGKPMPSEEGLQVKEEVAVVLNKPEPPKILTEVEKYQKNLEYLKEELYALRETNQEAKMNCLNDITAINYWMIKVLENEKDTCAFVDAIKQMKSYDKSASESCGRSSMRYVEWHGRIKPYVGKKLFQAEAGCSR